MVALRHRTFQAHDAQGICAFIQSAEELFFFFPKAEFPLTSKQVIDSARERESPTVAILDDQIVGYVNFIEARPNLYCTLGNLVVSSARRRIGVATFLVHIMIQKAREQYAARFVRASCFSHNTAAYQLYHGMGFTPTNMAQRQTPDGEVVLLVNLELALGGNRV